MLATFSECFPSANLEILLDPRESDDSPDVPVDFEINYLRHFPGDRVRRDLMTEEFKAYVAPFHALGQKSRISITELKQSLLVFPDRLVHQSLIQQVGGRGAGQDLKTWILSNPMAARELALHGQGIVFLPQWAVGGAERDGSLVNLKLPGIEMRRTCSAWWEAHRPLTWVAEVFLSLLAAEMNGG